MGKYIVFKLSDDQTAYSHGYRYSIWYCYDGFRIPFGKHCKTRAEVGIELDKTN